MTEFSMNHLSVAVPAPAVSALESPSIFQPEASGESAPPAYEIKFLLAEEQAREVERRIRGFLAPDPYADPSLGGAYRTTSLYTETPAFDVFRRVGEYGKSKLRVRRYGSAGPVFLERKDKAGDRVRKCRISVPIDDLTVLCAKRPPASWIGSWFHDQLAERRLAPVCRVSYDRVAYLGTADGGGVRVTFDRNVRGELAERWEITPVAARNELIAGLVICEFKYRSAMPRRFKEVVETLGLNPTPCSKYRRFMMASGVAPQLEPETSEGTNGESGRPG